MRGRTRLNLSAYDGRSRSVVEVHLDIAARHRVDETTSRLIDIRAGFKIDGHRSGRSAIGRHCTDIGHCGAVAHANAKECSGRCRAYPRVGQCGLTDDGQCHGRRASIGSTIDLEVQVLAVTAPVKVIVPSEA